MNDTDWKDFDWDDFIGLMDTIFSLKSEWRDKLEKTNINTLKKFVEIANGYFSSVKLKEKSKIFDLIKERCDELIELAQIEIATRYEERDD